MAQTADRYAFDYTGLPTSDAKSSQIDGLHSSQRLDVLLPWRETGCRATITRWGSGRASAHEGQVGTPRLCAASHRPRVLTAQLRRGAELLGRQVEQRL